MSENVILSLETESVKKHSPELSFSTDKVKMLQTAELYNTFKKGWHSHKHICGIRHLKERHFFCFPLKNVPCDVFFIAYVGVGVTFCRCSNGKYLPWLSQLLKSSVIIIKDRMKEGSYFSFSSQWESPRQVCMTYAPSWKWAVGPSRTPDYQSHFAPPLCCHITSASRRQMPTFIP